MADKLRVSSGDRASLLASAGKQMKCCSCYQQGNFKQEFRILKTDGSIRWLAAQGKVFYNDAGRAMRMTGIN